MRVGIYVRISSDRSGDEAGVDRQVEDGQRLVTSRDWDLVGIYKDNDISATHGAHRPEYERLMAAVGRGELDRIVVYHTSRLWRNRRERADGIERLKDARVSLVPVKGPELDMTTAYGRGMAGMVGEFDTMEVEVKSERQRRAVEQAVAQGRRYGGRRAFGYGVPVLSASGEPVLGPDGREIMDYDAVRESEAGALAVQYEELVAGSPLAQCARNLNNLGLWTPQLKRDGTPSEWTAQSLGLTMRNPRYIGVRAVKTGRGQWREIGPAVWPGIVAEPLFRAAGAILTDPRRRSGSSRRDQAMLTSVGWCGRPDCPSHVHIGGNALRQRTYRCRATMGHLSRQAEPVDEYISDVVVTRLERPDAVRLLRRDESGMDRVQAEADALRIRRRGLASLLADGTFTEDEVRAQAAELDDKIEALSRQFSDHRRMEVLGPLVHSSNVLATWEALAEVKKGVVVDTLMSVTLLPPGRGTRTFREESVLIVWKRFASP